MGKCKKNNLSNRRLEGLISAVSFSCGCVNGDMDAGCTVECGDVGGDIDACGPVTIRK